LGALDRGSAVDPRERAYCSAGIQRELSACPAEAEALIARGDTGAARSRLKAIDGSVGGLAAPAILELDARLAAP